jgi:hypothetical protein
MKLEQNNNAPLSIEEIKADVAKVEQQLQESDDSAFEDDKREPMNEAEHYINDRYQLRFNYISNEIEVAFKRNKPRFTILNANDLLREFIIKNVKRLIGR